jgi:uncharacterized protein
LLRRFGFPESKIPAAVETIRTHMPSGSPTTIEGHIVRDADILEQLGTITVLRTATKIGRDTRFPTMAEVAITLNRQLNGLPDQLVLDSAKQLAKPRIESLRLFLEQLQVETNGDL